MKKIPEVIPMPTAGQEIDSSIDMKLSKQDIIDMVIEETRENLTEMVAQARDDHRFASSEVDKTFEASKEAFIEAVKTKHKKFLSFIPTAEVRTDAGCGNSGLIATEYGILESKGIINKHVEDNDCRRMYVPFTTEGEEIRVKYELPGRCLFTTERSSKVDIVGEVSLPLSDAEIIKIFEPITSKLNNLKLAREKLHSLESQLQNVDKTSKRAKAQLVKRILESSKDGQALLANVGVIKTNVSQLLLKASTKA